MFRPHASFPRNTRLGRVPRRARAQPHPRDAADLRGEIQRAKETLSETSSCQLWVPSIKRDVQLTRKELDDLISDDVNQTVDALDIALRDAGVAPADLAGLYLVGGSSRIPLVSHRLQARFVAIAADDLHADGKAVGFALFFHNYSTFRGQPGLYLEDLFVREPFRRQGIGRALLASVARSAVERGCGRLEWSVLNWNTPAIEFYESLGARPLAEWTMYRMTGDVIARVAEDAG